MSLSLSLDFQYTTSIEKLWSAVTDSSKLAKWVVNIHNGQAMENDFKPVVGHRFQFRTQPINLHLEQTGFANAQGLEGARYGWTKWCGELEKVLEP